MAGLPRIGMLWMEGPLSYLEQLCIVSFRDAGHEIVLYHYGPLGNVPDGIALADAASVLPRDGAGLTHARTGSPALHSDLFRYRLLKAEPGMIWADTDAYCLRPFRTETGHFHGWESDSHVNGGVLGLPADSATLAALLAFTNDPYAIPPWYDDETQAAYRKAAEDGAPIHAGDMPWGVWGPHALTHALTETGEIAQSFPRHVLYPFTFKDRRKMLQKGFDTSSRILNDTLSIHFYGRRMRKRLVEAEGGVPHPGSLLGRLLRKHGIDPALAPIPLPTAPPETSEPPAKLAPEPAGTPALPGKRTLNLTDLADRYGSDKGSAKHRYTELYNLLFHALRGRALRFLEMGLQIGGPEHGNSDDRETSDVPSVRMWLDYFPKAQVFGLDVSDFSWFRHERFTFLRCDMGDRAALSAASKALPPLDIAIDDASHASLHQQLAFLEIFPRLKSGGIYIIEDLRWQPEVYEKQTPGLTKTAALFQSWITDRKFKHSDPALEREFRALSGEFSGCFLHQAHFDKHRKDQVLVVQRR